MSFDIKGTNNQVRLMLVEEGSIAEKMESNGNT